VARRVRVLLALAPLTAALGCALWLPATGPALAPCPGPLVPTERLGDDFTARDSARITGRDVDVALTLVLEKRGDRLLLVGLSALGAKRFSATQRGRTVEVEHFGPRPAVPAENVLRDLQRVHFPRALEAEASGAPAVRVERSRSPEGRPVTRIENPACGYVATYVTLSDEPRPEAAGDAP
jgi:hypothetical protein